MHFNLFATRNPLPSFANIVQLQLTKLKKRVIPERKNGFCHHINLIYVDMLGFTAYAHMQELPLSEYLNQNCRDPCETLRVQGSLVKERYLKINHILFTSRQTFYCFATSVIQNT